MTVVNIVVCFCLTLMLLWLVSISINLFGKNRADRITYLRGFKKGKGVFIYLFALPLYWVASVYDGESVFDSFFLAVRRIVEIVVLKYDFSPVKNLMQANRLFSVSIYICFVLVGLNAIVFAMSLASQSVWSYFRRKAFFVSRKEKLILFGNNAQNISIYTSDRTRKKILVDKLTDKDALSLYMKNVSYIGKGDFEDFIVKRVKSCVDGRSIVVIINTGDDDRNIAISRIFVSCLQALLELDEKSVFGALRIFVFGDPRYEAIYEDIVADACGCISYLNKYQKIAVDFIDQYPFTRFLSALQIDYDTSLIKQGVNINAVMLGFGKTNRQIFLTSVANNQFIAQTENGIDLKKVKYYIFDNAYALNNKNLNHNYQRYKNECKENGDYLPLPSYPADEYFFHLDVNDVTFYNEIRKICTASKQDANFVIIAFGSDLENMDMAQKLLVKRREWECENLVLFVKVRGKHIGQELFNEPNCYWIGEENKVVYNIDNILSDKISKMAQMRDRIYDLEYAMTHELNDIDEETIRAVTKKAQEKWYLSKSQMERDSSLYCCLSLRSKLNLMGLDYCPKEANDVLALSEAEYMEIYAGSDKPDTTYYPFQVEGKPIVHYTLDFPDSRRRNMAIHEHLRWNSFMISKGTVPATKEQILREEIEINGKKRKTNGKNYSMRRHGNLTTFEGLIAFRKMIAQRDGKEEIATDVIKYDYQLLDDAYWLLSAAGYKIIKLSKK